MIPELTSTFGLTTVGISSMIGLYYYTYSSFSIVAGASLDRFGAKYVIPVGILLTAIGAIMFGLASTVSAEAGRLFQGAGSAFAFTGAVYLASRGLAQVSMNLMDYRRTPVLTALRRVEEEAAALGTRVVGTEVVGLVPAAAVLGVAPEKLKLPGPPPILEEGFSPQIGPGTKPLSAPVLPTRLISIQRPASREVPAHV